MTVSTKTYAFKNRTFQETDFVENGKIKPLGVEYLREFKRFSLFDSTGSAILFTLCLPVIIPLALMRVLLLVSVFGFGMFLKKYLSISLDNYPRIVSLIYFMCLGIHVKSIGSETTGGTRGDAPQTGGLCQVILANHRSRIDALLLANLHQSDSTYLKSARESFFGKLIIDSGLCARSMVDGLALDTKEGREEWRRRLKNGYQRSMLFFPEGRIVHPADAILTFQTHLFHGQKADIICKKNAYKSYFFKYAQIEAPFYKPPYSRLKHKRLWDSLVEVLPFFVAWMTVMKTEVIGEIRFNGTETPEEINEALYAIYFKNGYRLVSLEPELVKKLMNALYL
jgi:1-acyl-sn-glycerol-3-phosphate acyltransferase